MKLLKKFKEEIVMPFRKPKIVTAEEAVSVIHDGMTLAINAMASTSYPDTLSVALYERYQKTKTPQNLTFWGATAQAMYTHDGLTERLARCKGMITKATLGHWISCPSLSKNAGEGKIAGYNLPQGIISHLYRAAAGRKPVVVSRIGLKTFADPRFGGGKLNNLCDEDMVEVVKIDGKEYLQYKTPKIDVCFVRGTTADPSGNITSEKEAAYVDALTLAMAAKANDGIVIAQVERLSDRRSPAKAILIPGVLIDYLVVDPEQRQTHIEIYNPAYSGETIMPAHQIKDHINSVLEKSGDFFAERQLVHYIIARRAAEEIKSGDVVNIGIGMPGLVPGVIAEKGIQDSILMTNEVGTLGGVPAPAGSFGASLNPMMITDMPTMFDFYDGGILDVVCVGAAQIDKGGNVNTGKIGSRIIGVGGFTNITFDARKVVFLTTFMDIKGMETEYANGALIIKKEGGIQKFIDSVEQISFSGEIAVEDGKEILYVTERCVFRLTPKGLMITEIAPGMDIEKDIIANMGFKPLIADDMILMKPEFFKI